MANWKNNRKQILLVFLLINIGSYRLFSQEIYRTNSGEITFDAAKTALEPIHAKNKKVKTILRINDGALVALLHIKDFIFPNSLMQEHFNENYMESDQYPSASLKAKIDNLDFDTSKIFDIQGVFAIHGVEKELPISIKLEKIEMNYKLTSRFKLLLQDFNIKIPSLMFYKIAEEVEVIVEAELIK